MEDWETITFDVQNWMKFMKDLGCDEGSRRSLMLLAGFRGSKGRDAANDTIHKCLKKVADNHVVDNWSAFVHKICLSERHRIQAEDNASGGWHNRKW